jgi:hypothetical protein
MKSNINVALKVAGVSITIGEIILLFYLITLMILSSCQATAQPVYIYTGYGQMPVDKVKYGAWNWNQSLGTLFYYAGTSIHGVSDGSITIRVGSITEWASRPVDGVSSPEINKCEVVISPYLFFLNNITQALVSHELGHCMGAGEGLPNNHSDNPIDLMYPIVGSYGITQHDTQMVFDTPLWPMGLPSYCHSIVDSDWNLYIPQISGVMAKSSYIGDHLLNHTWSIPTVSPNNTIACPGNAISTNGIVSLPDVRVYNTGNFNAILIPVVGGYRLYSATLIN